jgi:uncharacterized protein
MRASALAILLLLVGVFAPAAALDLPPLTGRVVDNAGVLSPDGKARIELKLANHETKTTDQIVVATVPSLQGDSVEEFANLLFRAWKLGQTQKNNGVLLLVAPIERKVRIEVGYGLEGTLTDALSKVIISSAVAPKFKTGDFNGGIEAGIDAVIATLLGDEEWQQRARVRNDAAPDDYAAWIAVFLVLAFIFIVFNMSVRSIPPSNGAHRKRNGRWVAAPSSSGWGGSWGGGGGWSSGGSSSGSSGGFSGGGGSSGGGGASGDW